MNSANPAAMFTKRNLSKTKNNIPVPVNMDDNEPFVVEDVSQIIKDTLEAVLNGSMYNVDRIKIWSTNISDQCLNQLAKLKKNFKYIITCNIMQKTGSGLHTASACFWDTSTDGQTTVRWENDSMYCIVTVFGAGI
ncbi:dynein light chain Tctex-type 1-like [Aethina tumida]|uniref:dynein light chain Tctex-type 1-like n=1 Tax=Aethina tumida TaxID=116153 RepID=UPI002148B8D7|nr:dynein light chain Tctex-type 1-like [Aethina tumida]